MTWTETRPRLWLTKWVVTYANMTSPEANRSRRIIPSTRAIPLLLMFHVIGTRVAEGLWASEIALRPPAHANRRRAALAGDRDPPSDNRRTAGCRPPTAIKQQTSFMPQSVARCMEGMASLH
jgi:hypothetical protein